MLRPILKTAVLLAPGFEDIEAVTSIDVLRRADIPVAVASVGVKGLVTSAHGLSIQTDCAVEDLVADDLALVVLPGGMPGASNLKASRPVRLLLEQVRAGGGLLAAICAAPIVLHAAGILTTQLYTCYPSFEKEIGGHYTADRVRVDDRLITACGPGASLEFALELVSQLGKPEVAAHLNRGMLV